MVEKGQLIKRVMEELLRKFSFSIGPQKIVLVDEILRFRWGEIVFCLFMGGGVPPNYVVVDCMLTC